MLPSGEKEKAQSIPPKRQQGQEEIEIKTAEPRSDPILIKRAKGKTYADVLKEICTKARPHESEFVIHTVRHTGDVLLELGANSQRKDEFGLALKHILGGKTTVRNLETKITPELRDFYSYTTEKEAIKIDVIAMEGELRITLSKANSRALKLAIVQMSEKNAEDFTH